MTYNSAQAEGRYGRFGGCYVPEILIAPLEELKAAWERARKDADFRSELARSLQEYGGRPTPLTETPRYAEAASLKGRLFLKREDLLHTGAHKLNNVMGQSLLARAMGKRRLIAETGAGQHGVATATACARLGLDCIVYMGSVDMERQRPNVERMKLLGTEVVPVDQGAATLKDAINEALRDWSASYEHSHYCLGSALGPHPFPEMVRVFQSVIGREAREQMLRDCGRLPDEAVACVGGGSNAIGLFSGFVDDKEVRLIGVEAGGRGPDPGDHAARFSGGREGVLHGCYTFLLQDPHGQIQSTHSVSAGLDYPAVGPEHAHLKETGRAFYTSVEDESALEAMRLLARTEGILPALESSHALAYVAERAKDLEEGSIVLVNLSGRGDKDLPQLFEGLGEEEAP